jgi:hypothetical protein
MKVLRNNLYLATFLNLGNSLIIIALLFDSYWYRVIRVDDTGL